MQDLEAYSIGFDIDLVQSIGKTVVDNLSDTLKLSDTIMKNLKTNIWSSPFHLQSIKDLMITERTTNLSHIIKLLS